MVSLLIGNIKRSAVRSNYKMIRLNFVSTDVRIEY
jgi:hypothetical protein